MPRALPKGLRFLLGAAAFFIVIAGLRAASGIFVPLVFALFLSFLTAPALLQLRRRRVPIWVAVALVMLVVAGVLSMVGIVFSAALQSATAELPAYQERLAQLVRDSVGWVEARGIDIPASVITDSLELGAVFDVATKTLRSVATALGHFVLVLLVLGFALAEMVELPAKLRLAFGDRGFDVQHLATVARRVQRYLLIKTLVSTVTGIAVGLWVAALGLDFAVLWGLVAFLLNYIPTIGSIVAAIPTALVALLQLGPTRALVVVIGYLVINIVVGNIIEPSVMGRGMRLSPLVVLLSVIFWGWVWGPVGAILAVPLTVTIKILLENNEGFGWLAVLLDRRARSGKRRSAVVLASSDR